jgi:TonB family protein
MRERHLMCVGLVAVVAAGSAISAGPAGASSLNTRVRLLVGRPPAAGAEGTGVFLLPGTVVMPGSDVPSKEQDLTALRLKLLDTYRLAELEVRSETDMALALDRETPVATEGKGVDIRLTLLGYDERVATYRVFLQEPGSPPATPTVSVPRGERGVVGSRDGKDAPYLFLILEPAGVGRKKAPGDSALSPTLISKVNPTYPEEARKKKITGIVRVEALIRKDGTIGEVKVLESPDESLSEAAVQAVRQWRYKPPVDAAGVPHDIRYTVTIRFVLN